MSQLNILLRRRPTPSLNTPLSIRPRLRRLPPSILARLLFRKPRLGNLMLFAELVPRNKETYHQSHGRNTRIHDPHRVQTLRKRCPGNRALGGGESVYNAYVCAGTGARELVPYGWAEGGAERGRAFVHFVLVDDAADDDGDGGGKLADKSERGGRGRDIAGCDFALESDQGGLEVGPDADAEDNLVDYYFGPAAGSGEVDEETHAENHEGHAEPDWG